MVRMKGALALILALSLCASACGGMRQAPAPESGSGSSSTAAPEPVSQPPEQPASSRPEESQSSLPEEDRSAPESQPPEAPESPAAQAESSRPDPGSQPPAPSESSSQAEISSAPDAGPDPQPESGPEEPEEPPPSSSQPEPEPAPGEATPPGCRWLNITEATVLTLINKERVRQGLQPLTMDTGLTAAARVRADELYRGNYVGHTRPGGEPWETVLQQDVPLEFAFAAENLAWSNHAVGQDIPAFQWFQMWKESESHYAAMMGERYTHCGVAVLAGPYFDGEEQSYAVTLFCSY